MSRRGLVLLATASIACAGGDRAPALVEVGQPAPLYAARTLGGDSISTKSLAGRVVLLNVWATWCAPCREEMPSLDRLQKELGSDTFEVVALAVDRGGADAAGKFLKGINVENLKVYADPTTKSGNALRVLGMPTTILINADGKEAGRIAGPAEWDSDAAKRLIADVKK